MINIEEFRKTVARMFRSTQDSTFLLDDTKKPCKGVHCVDCPIFEETNITSDKCMINNLSIFDAFDIIEAVEKWGEEHPIITNGQKYKEAWGVEPRNESGALCCPKYMGLLKDLSECYPFSGECGACKEKFWSSEYKEPKEVEE